MGIRESLLNTITSVGNGDFIRIVTSAGASSKATLANVFKSFESGLGAKSSLTTSDYVRVVGSDNVSYKQLLSDVLASGGMGELITSSGGWQSDNAKTAFENAYESWANNTVHVGVLKAGSVAAYIAFKADAQYGAAHFLTYDSASAQEYTRNLYGGTWGNIINKHRMLRYIVTIPSVTIGPYGYTNITNYYPGPQEGYAFLTAVCYNFGTASPASAFTVLGNSNYVAGQPNATITNLQIAYIYAPAVEARS